MTNPNGKALDDGMGYPWCDDLHTWWELSYAHWLTIPRIAMMSMPAKWRDQMAALLNELDDTLDWRPKDGMYFVTFRKKGKMARLPIDTSYRRAKLWEHKK